MKNKSLPELSRAEYDVLSILWKHEQSSVREIHDCLASKNNWAYTTTKTVMDRMVKKKLLKRSRFHGVFVYQALISRPAGMAWWVKFFADRILESDYKSVVAMFADHQSISADEIEELNRLLESTDQYKADI